MTLWLIIQLLIITAFIAGYLVGSNKRIAIKEAVNKVREALPQRTEKYKILQKKQPQTQEEKTLETLQKEHNAPQ